MLFSLIVLVLTVSGCTPTTFYEQWLDEGMGEQYCQDTRNAIQKINAYVISHHHGEDQHPQIGEDLKKGKVSVCNGCACGTNGGAVYKIELCMPDGWTKSLLGGQLMTKTTLAWNYLYGENGVDAANTPINLSFFQNMASADDFAAGLKPWGKAKQSVGKEEAVASYACPEKNCVSNGQRCVPKVVPGAPRVEVKCTQKKRMTKRNQRRKRTGLAYESQVGLTVVPCSQDSDCAHLHYMYCAGASRFASGRKGICRRQYESGWDEGSQQRVAYFHHQLETEVGRGTESLAFAETAPSWTATATNVLAAFGVAVTAYGAFKHYVGK